MIYRHTVTNAYIQQGARTRPLYRATQIVWYMLGIIETLLAFRFILRAMNANTATGFVTFIYSITAPLVTPFIAVFRGLHVSTGTLEWNALLAMLVYWLLAWAIVKLFVMNKPVSTLEADEKLNEQSLN